MAFIFKIAGDHFLVAVNFAKSNLGVPDLIFKEKQLGALESAYNTKDCVAVLPTGYEKSLILLLVYFHFSFRFKKRSVFWL